MLEAILALVVGLLTGSFLNVCIHRWPRDLSVVRPRSYCPACQHALAWYDNVPLVSYLLLGGRCRHCCSLISWRYPLVELLTGGLFFALVLTHGPTLVALKWCVFSGLLIGLIFADLEQQILPDELTLTGIVAGLALVMLAPAQEGIVSLLLSREWSPARRALVEALIGGAFAAGLLWWIGLVYKLVRRREGMGFGDVKMVGMIGVFLGLQGALFTVVVGSILGSVAGVAYTLARRKPLLTQELPFGTFLGIAALALVFLWP
ncbi:MAG: prepilin peptidase [Acidobacteria bacterium]|nr:prepilin peptidase [Acidobacteriota bacterium]